MADETADADPQDVLSSIRRLVGDEGTVPDASPRKTGSDSKLVLTPALRVAPDEGAVDETDAEPPEVEEPPEEDHGTRAIEQATEDLRSLSALEATIAELESAVESEPDFELDGGERGSVLDQPPSHLREARDTGEDPRPARRRRLTLGLSEPPAEDEPAATAQDAPAATKETPVVPRSDTPGVLRLVSPVNDLQAEADAGIYNGADDPGSDEVAADEFAHASSAPSESPAEDVEEVLLDEDTLREMVAEIVREELRGSLGEQITSNIRKLIRREIHDYFDVHDNE